MTPIRRLAIAPALTILLAACSSGAVTPPDSAPSPAATAPSTATSTEPAASQPASSGPATDPQTSAPGTPDAPAVPVLDQPWATAELTDVATGESFRIADHAGQTVILETMAIWCSNCLRQQGRIDEALAALDPAKVVYVVIDVDPNETGASLAKYREKHQFDGRYAVADRDLARALAAEFGDQVLNPPSTPVVFIGSDGRVTLTDYGPKSVDDIVALAKEHGA